MRYSSTPHDLMLDWATSPGFHIQLRLRPWSQGIDGVTTVNGEMQALHPLDDLGLPLALLIREPQAQPWVQQLPAPLLPALLRFESTFPGKTFPLLWYGCRHRWAIELLLSEPMLLALLLHGAQQERWSTHRICALGRAKRTHILAACGLPATQRVINLLHKLHMTRCADQEFHWLRHGLASPDHASLSQLGFLDIPLFRALARHPEIVRSRWLRAYHPHWDWRPLLETIPDLYTMALSLGLTDVIQRLCQCPNTEAVLRLHDRLVTALNNREDAVHTGLSFPTPPLAGTATIVPITNSHLLALEGRLQRHCIASYQSRILGGHYYVYRVLAPERATLGLRQFTQGWALDQLRLLGNASPSADTHNTVAQWLLRAHRTPKPLPELTQP